MRLIKLNIHNVRNIKKQQILPHPKVNIITGLNGSGKTSILEAIYLLGNGRSFRTRETDPLINYTEEALTVFAEFANHETLSIEKSKKGATRVQLNGLPCVRSSELAYFFPCQIFYQDIFQIIDAGPLVRRAILDWGGFYQDKTYNHLLREYRHVVKQRNALLRQKAPRSRFAPWDALLVEMSLQIDVIRSNYFYSLEKSFQQHLAKLSTTTCKISYYKGWDKKSTDKSLMEILDEQFASDLQRQFTHSGAHNADIYFDSAELKAKQTLSRGQQKIILMALKFAQSALLPMPCVYLLDDVSAELDKQHFTNLLELINSISGQFFFTAINPNIFTENIKQEDLLVFAPSAIL